MYNVIKAQNKYVYDKRIPQWPCLCQICEKIVLLAYNINKLVEKANTFRLTL